MFWNAKYVSPVFFINPMSQAAVGACISQINLYFYNEKRCYDIELLHHPLMNYQFKITLFV